MPAVTSEARECVPTRPWYSAILNLTVAGGFHAAAARIPHHSAGVPTIGLMDALTVPGLYLPCRCNE